MASNLQNLNLGTHKNDGTGDSLHTAFGKVKDNFASVVSDIEAIESNAIVTANNVGNGQLLISSVNDNGTSGKDLNVRSIAAGANTTVSLVDDTLIIAANQDIVVEHDADPALGGNLDLNTNNIVGLGNINISGDITAQDTNVSSLTAASTTISGGTIDNTAIGQTTRADANFNHVDAISLNAGTITGLIQSISNHTLDSLGDVVVGALADGMQLVYNSTYGIWEAVAVVGGTSGGGASVTVSPTEPVGASNGDLWCNTVDGNLYVYYDSGSGLAWTISTTGQIGYTGSAGATGSTGYVGSRGSLGYTGSVGTPGITGYTGSAGTTGSTGFVGSRGLLGYTGSQGATGFVGSTGLQGALGYTGSQGIPGAYAALGYTGSAGTNGYTGSAGTNGYTGSAGAGFTGSAGIAGDLGYTGSAGTNGINGYTGSIGYTGSAGGIGPTGYTGSLGYTGSGAALGNLTLTNSTFTSTDADVVFSPNVVCEADLTADRFISSSAGTPTLESSTNIEISAAGAVIVTQSPLRFASLTTTERDLLLAQNGDVIYNSTTNKFQGYANSTWVDLH